MKLINPFADRGAIVRDPARFVGRKEELAKIRRRVIDGQFHSNLAIIGEKKIGSSSLAYNAFFRDKETLRDEDESLHLQRHPNGRGKSA